MSKEKLPHVVTDNAEEYENEQLQDEGDDQETPTRCIVLLSRQDLHLQSQSAAATRQRQVFVLHGLEVSEHKSTKTTYYRLLFTCVL